MNHLVTIASSYDSVCISVQILVHSILLKIEKVEASAAKPCNYSDSLCHQIFREV